MSEKQLLPWDLPLKDKFDLWLNRLFIILKVGGANVALFLLVIPLTGMDVTWGSSFVSSSITLNLGFMIHRMDNDKNLFSKNLYKVISAILCEIDDPRLNILPRNEATLRNLIRDIEDKRFRRHLMFNISTLCAIIAGLYCLYFNEYYAWNVYLLLVTPLQCFINYLYIERDITTMQAAYAKIIEETRIDMDNASNSLAVRVKKRHTSRS